jgi:Lrp/AsnC family transcriptional regulator for asnA, asnC and gidA
MEKIKLDLIDKKILAELDKNCRIPNSKLAKIVNKSREAVKYRIQQLEKNGIIQKYITSINPNKLGYYMFKVYLQLENIPKERERFYEFLKNQKTIYWMGISDGAFDCVFAILSRNIIEFYDEINNMLSQFKGLIVKKVLGMMVDTRQYNKKFFMNDKNGKYVIFGGNVEDNKIDDLDQKILEILANDARIPITELARKVNSTIEIVRTRIKKMEEKGIILGYRIAVDFNKLGLEFFKAIIYFKSLSSEDEKSLFEWMKQHPNSLYYIRSLAPWEVEFEFAVENYQQFNQIINDLRKRFPHVISHHEHLIMIYETWMPAYLIQ